MTSQLVKAKDFPLIGGSYVARSGRFLNMKSIGLYPEMNESGSPGKESQIGVLLSVPGKREIQDLLQTDDPIRGIWVPTNNSASMYVVVNNTVFKFLSNFTFEALVGNLSTTQGEVSISDNGIDLMIVDGQFGYWSALDSTELTQINDSHFYPSNSVDFINGWFVFNRVGTNQFFWSDLYAHTFPDLNVAGKSGSSDIIIGLKVNNQQIYLFGEQTTEVWQPIVGNANTPFAEIVGKLIQAGCASPFSVRRVNTTLVWVGNVTGGSGIVYALQNDQPQRISNHAVEKTLTSVLENLTACTSWTYEQDGHVFYNLLVPGLDTTLSYDFAMPIQTGWSDRQSIINGVRQQDRANCHTYFRGSHIVGSQYGSKIYALDFDVFKDGDDPLLRSRQTTHSSNSLNRVIYNELEIDFQFGVGINNDPDGVWGSNPVAVLYMSDDGGKTWSDGLTEELGMIGDWRGRARWYNLGYGYDTVFRIEVTDPVDCQILSAKLYVELCDA